MAERVSESDSRQTRQAVASVIFFVSHFLVVEQRRAAQQKK